MEARGTWLGRHILERHRVVNSLARGVLAEEISQHAEISTRARECAARGRLPGVLAPRPVGADAWEAASGRALFYRKYENVFKPSQTNTRPTFPGVMGSLFASCEAVLYRRHKEIRPSSYGGSTPTGIVQVGGIVQLVCEPVGALFNASPEQRMEQFNPCALRGNQRAS